MTQNQKLNLQANNTVYFKAFNSDYRIGGIYHNLDSSELRIIIILQAYSDGRGVVCMGDNNGYDIKTLSHMFGLNYRTTKRGLISLSDKQLISIDEDGIIVINGFADNQLHRQGTKIDGHKKAMAIQLNTILNRLDKAGITNKSTGETV